MASGPLAFLGQSDQPLLRRSVLDDVTGNPLITSAPTGEVRQRASLLPLGVTDSGSMTLAVPQMAFDAIDAMRAPQRAYSGDLPIWDPATGHTTDEARGAAAGLAGLAMTGSMPFSAPSGAIRMFGGPNAKTADLAALKEAQWLHNAGGDREHIWDATGWFKAPDGNWKFEIPDELSTIGTPKNAPPGYGQLHHDDLAQAYPSMWQNTGQSIREAPVTSGRYDALGDAIHAQGPTDAAQRSVALHEMQHAIQREENFARGDNPGAYRATDWEAAGRPMLSEAPNAAAAHSAWARDQYHRSAGEVEARNVQTRADMTPKQRFNTPPWVTQDVPDTQQIVKFGESGPQASLGAGTLDDLLASMSSAIDQHAGSVAPDVRPINRVDPKAASWDLYHGTDAPTDFGRFDPNLPKAQRGHTPGSETGGVFLSPAADEAAQYSGSIGGRPGAEAGPRVIRTTVDPGKTDVFDLPYLMEHDPSFIARARQTTIDDAGGRQAAGQMFDERHARMLDEFQSARDLNKQLADLGYPATEVPQVQWGYGATGAAMQMARERGLDTAVLRGLSESNGGDQVVALTPGRVRSYYDPSQLLYSGGPAGMVGLPFLGRDR